MIMPNYIRVFTEKTKNGGITIKASVKWWAWPLIAFKNTRPTGFKATILWPFIVLRAWIHILRKARV